MSIAPYIETHSGKHFYFQNPTAEMVDIEDIAYALSMQCRFNGHCSAFYSVAEHSVYVASLLPPQFQLAGLLHDAAEAYITDMPSPIKQFLPDYIVMENRIAETISDAFKLDGDGEDYIRKADRQQLCTEAYYLLPGKGEGWTITEGYQVENGRRPVGMPPHMARDIFLEVYHELTKPTIVLA